MKLADWAREQGLDYKTAHRWFKSGILPVKAIQLSTGTILIQKEPKDAATGVAIYARVSSSDQKADLDRQLARLIEFANSRGLAVTETVSEIGSGLNGRRSKLLSLLKNAKVGTVVVEHRERLARFGVEYIEAALEASGRKLVVADESELKDDLVRDVTDVLTSLCARLYGKRSAKNRAARAVVAATAVS